MSPVEPLLLDRAPPFYEPGETLQGRFTVQLPDGTDAEAVELAVLWHTDGKGDEDYRVYHFERREVGDDHWPTAGRPRSFAVRLPDYPLSYDGLVVKICWCARLRLFQGADERVVETPFRLGNVAPAEEAVS